MNPEIKYYHSLDGLRAVAAFAVIIAHFFGSENASAHPFVLRVAALGNSGVSLFFVLSGFVITRILLQSRNSPHYFKCFYARRVLRIFPLYYFALLCYYYAPYFFGMADRVAPFSDQIYFWVYLQNFARTFHWHASGPGHFWSLAVEEHFYLIWPAIIYFSYRKKVGLLSCISAFLLLLPLALRYWLLSKGLKIDVFTFTRLDQLTLGGILAILESQGFLENKYSKYYGVIFVSGLFLIGYVSRLNYFDMNLFKHCAFGICYFGLIALSAASSTSSGINKLLALPIMQYLGKISYGLYVWSVIAIQVVKKYLSTNLVFVDFVLASLVTVLISAASFKLLETPF